MEIGDTLEGFLSNTAKPVKAQFAYIIRAVSVQTFTKLSKTNADELC